MDDWRPGDPDEYNWCSYCGNLWCEPDGMKPMCRCHPSGLRPFPKELQATVSAAKTIGGYKAVNVIERELFKQMIIDETGLPLVDLEE